MWKTFANLWKTPENLWKTLGKKYLRPLLKIYFIDYKLLTFAHFSFNIRIFAQTFWGTSGTRSQQIPRKFLGNFLDQMRVWVVATCDLSISILVAGARQASPLQTMAIAFREVPRSNSLISWSIVTG